MQASKVQPAVLGGVFIGVLSALPIVSAGNFCCCLWVLSGGVLAAYLLQQNQPAPLTTGDAAAVGALAGIVGAVIKTIIAIPFALLLGPMQIQAMQRALENPDIPPEMRRILEMLASGGFTVIGIVVGLVISLVLYTVFGMLGGMLGTLFFKKNLPPAPPPVPPPLT
jgi:hypothetical protein